MKRILIVVLAVMASAVLSANAADVKELWEQNCTKCHGADGKGDTKMGKKAGVKDYTDPKVQAEINDETAFKSLKDGLKKDGKELMKPYSDKLSDDEIKALVAYTRTFKK